MFRQLLLLTLLLAALGVTGCTNTQPRVLPDDDDDDATADDDDATADDDDATADDDDATADDDDATADDDDATADDDDATADDDDATADDDDATADGCAEGPSVECGSTVTGNNGGPDSTNQVDVWGCIGFDLTGPELAYVYLADTTGDVTVTVDGIESGQDIDLLILENTCDSTSCITSSNNFDQAPEEATFAAVAGTTYYFVVDGWSLSVSDFSLTVTCGVVGDDDDATGDDDDATVDDDDTTVDDDDVTADDDDVTADDDDVTADDDDITADDDDITADDDDITADDDDATAGGEPDLCTVDYVFNCTDFSEDLGWNNSNTGSTQVVEEYSCDPTLNESGPEVAYTYTAGFDGDLTVTLSNMTDDLDLFALLDVAGDCDANECIDHSAGTGDEAITLTVTEGTTYYFVVDGFEGAVSDYDFVLDCPGCIDAWDLSCDFATDVYNNGDLGSTDVIDEYSCDSALDESGPEYVYEFTAPIAGEYTVELTGLTANLDLFVLDDGADEVCDPALCVAYSDNAGLADESVTVTTSDAGAIAYVVVDGFAGAVGDYTIEVTCPDGLCEENAPSSPLDCLFNTDSDDTFFGSDDIDEYSCISWDETGPELVYAFSPTISGDYTFELSSIVGGDVDLFILEADAVTGQCSADACIDYADSTTTTTLSNDSDYFIVVDGFEGDDAAYTLTVTCPECADDFPLNCISNTDTWNNGFGASDWDSYVGCPLGTLINQTGPEYVYAYTAVADGDVTVDLTGMTADLDLIALLAGADGDCDPTQCVEDSATEFDESLTLSVLTGETYYFVVDGFLGAVSGYTITLSCL